MFYIVIVFGLIIIGDILKQKPYMALAHCFFMNKVYNAVIVLSHHLNQNGTLSDESRERVERGVSLFHDGRVRTILMSGGYADKSIDVSHASVMRNEAIRSNVNPERICTEEKSLDTIGQAIFTKTDVVVQKKWRRLIIVSHDYHIKRVKSIFDFVYGKNFKLEFVGIVSGKIDNYKIKEQETNLLDMFGRLFKRIGQAHDKKIVKRLFARHPLYKIKSQNNNL